MQLEKEHKELQAAMNDTTKRLFAKNQELKLYKGIGTYIALPIGKLMELNTHLTTAQSKVNSALNESVAELEKQVADKDIYAGTVVDECGVCRDVNKVCDTVLQCGHIFCIDCAFALGSKPSCPKCRKISVDGVLRLFGVSNPSAAAVAVVGAPPPQVPPPAVAVVEAPPQVPPAVVGAPPQVPSAAVAVVGDHHLKCLHQQWQ
jgi:hypothetical protein